MHTNRILTLESHTLKFTGVTICNPEPTDIHDGVTAVVGPNGSGKSTLARIIERGRNFATNKITTVKPDLRVKTIEFGDRHSLSGFKAEYYQQRYEATMNDEVPTVGELLGERIKSPIWKELTETLRLIGAEEKKVNFLSSGELRKLLIINMLFDLPDLLILDNPYIGLDATGRKTIDEAIEAIGSKGVAVLLLLSDPADIPASASRTIWVDRQTICKEPRTGMFDHKLTGDIPAPGHPHVNNGEEVFALHHCPVTHGGVTLLPDVDWTVRQGECWSLSGPNGVGKSTLLSLVHADNPQAYARPVSLFGRQRGTGETIWEIKRRIGYISAEMHLYFNGGNNTVLNVVAQGLNDTVGMYKKLTAEQIDRAMEWLRLFNITDLADRRFSTLSSGEQRLVLLVRTLIKNPELLILDEPFHGLDAGRKQAAISAIDTMCRRDGTTLVFVTHCPEEVPGCVTRHFELHR